MNPALPDAAVELGTAARKAFAALGGVDAAREAELRPETRSGEVADTLRSLGLDDIDPLADEESLGAAAALCLEAGRVALPYPVVGALLRDADGRPYAVVPEGRARVDHGDLFDEWVVSTLHGDAQLASPDGTPLATKLGPFVTNLAPKLGLLPGATHGKRPSFAVVLAAWQVLGTCERAVELATEHVTERVQFGKPLSAFQAVQFQLADAAVAAAGLRELAGFTLWRLLVAPDDALVDALALRLHALDVARAVLRTTQQLHGAAGVCDEYDVSVLARHTQPALRLPFGAERAAAELADAVDRSGFDGLFPHGAGR